MYVFQILNYIERNAGQSILSDPLQFLQLYQDVSSLKDTRKTQSLGVFVH